jgi:hypothetical protein
MGSSFVDIAGEHRENWGWRFTHDGPKLAVFPG